MLLNNFTLHEKGGCISNLLSNIKLKLLIGGFDHLDYFVLTALYHLYKVHARFPAGGIDPAGLSGCSFLCNHQFTICIQNPYIGSCIAV